MHSCSRDYILPGSLLPHILRREPGTKTTWYPPLGKA